jgi:GT2 family glycosyltransferase
MSATPDVSVVIVAWQAREHVLACLRSLAEEVALDHEVIVVDDGSTDGTTEAVRSGFPSARVLAQPGRQGLVAGRNAALPEVRGRLVLMLDADTRVQRGAVETLAAALDADPRIGLVGPRLVYPDGSLQLSCRRYPPLLLPLLRRGPWGRVDPDPPAHRRHLMKDFDHASARPVVWVAGAAQMWRADLPALIGTFDPRISSYGGEDIDWCLRVWRAGLEVHYVPQAEVVHVSQRVTRRRRLAPESMRALVDYYYLQLKHRGLRRDPRLERALA